MKEIGQLTESDGRYEFRIPEMSLVVRGDHPEWVIMAVGEVIANTAKMEQEGRIDELQMLVEFEEATEIEVDSEKFAMQQRFEVIPQCVVTMGRLDYRWVAEPGRSAAPNDFDGQPVRRIHDMSLTYGDSFLHNEDGVDTSSDDTSQQ